METITITKTENWYMATSSTYVVEGYGSTPKKALRRYMRKRKALKKKIEKYGQSYTCHWV